MRNLSYLLDVSPLYLLAWVLALASVSAVVVVCPLADIPLSTVLALIAMLLAVAVVIMLFVVALIALGVFVMATLNRVRHRAAQQHKEMARDYQPQLAGKDG